LEFKGAELGMSLADWKAAPFPARISSPVAAVCSNDPQGAAAGLKVTAAQARFGEIVCTYVSAGTGSPDWQVIPITDQFMADHVIYGFRAGRLTSITYQTSADAFDNVVARIKAQIGPSSQVQRDRMPTRWGVDLQRVKMFWRTPAASAQLVDPSTRPDKLSVTLSTGAG
jgi:hypothetical protein